MFDAATFRQPRVTVLPPTRPEPPERGGEPPRIHIQIEIVDRRESVSPPRYRFGSFTLALLVLAALAALAGCAPELVAANERGGIVSHTTGLTQASAFSIADAHCHKFGRVAQVTGMDFVYNRLMFACVEP